MTVDTALLDVEAISREPRHDDRDRTVKPRKCVLVVDWRVSYVAGRVRVSLAQVDEGRPDDCSKNIGVRRSRGPNRAIAGVGVWYDEGRDD
jgi:hypothetical protein